MTRKLVWALLVLLALVGPARSLGENPTILVPGSQGGWTNFFLQPTASDNHAAIKGTGPGLVGGIYVTNNSTTVNYLRLYNAGTGFNGCNSATNLVLQVAIPAAAASNAASQMVPVAPQGLGGFTSGISICVTSGYATNDTTNATATAMSVNVLYN